MLEVCSVSELLMIPIHALEPVVQYWIVVAYGTEIAFLPYVRSAKSLEWNMTYKVLYIDSIEANQSGVKSNI
jgi:hypothetical protein